LYAALSDIIAEDPRLHRVLLAAPVEQQLPVLLLACVHALLIAEPDHELARWYPNLTDDARVPDDPRLAPCFTSFVIDRADPLHQMVTTRRTQTNEIGRCANFVVAFGILETEVGPLAHVDVGASGGLNMAIDRYQYRFAPGGLVGAPSTVQLDIGVRGAAPIPHAMPEITARIGIDVAPIDVTDPAQARWLEACVWPDHADRFARLHAAIEIARQTPPEIIAGDARTSVAGATRRVGAHGHVVLTNSWVLNYFSPAQRVAYLAELDRLGAEQDLSWVSFESPALVPELPAPAELDHPDLTSLAITRWRDGTRSTQHVASCHPHGRWIHWR
jgi:hypothetical protein